MLLWTRDSRSPYSPKMLKLFGIVDFWKRNPLDDSAERIERALLDRTRRLVAGIHIQPNFDKVSGTLAVAKGRGRSLRVIFCDHVSRKIPPALRNHCLELLNCKDQFSAIDHREAIAELADVQVAVVEELKQKANKYVDRILAVSVVEPGIWSHDGVHLLSFCDATRLAERTGVNVIDALPDRDIAAGGRGKPLEPLPLWLLQADRDARIARKANVCLLVEETTTGYLLPPSDGLDAEIPEIQSLQTEGLALIDGLLGMASMESREQVSQLLVSGVHSKQLIAQWQSISDQDANIEQRVTSMLEAAGSGQGQGLSAEQLLCSGMTWISENCQTMIEEALQQLRDNWAAKRVRLERELSAAAHITKRKGSAALEAFEHSLPDLKSPGCITIDAPHPISAGLASRIQNLYEGVNVSGVWDIATPQETSLSSTSIHGPSLVAALLGVMHIDQMPANIPSLTGANQQRILGRLTPGRPNAWRNLVREIADNEPSAMKLRDAV